MPEYTNLQIAVLTIDKDSLNEAAGIIADWTGRLLNGWFEDNETGEDRHYEMPADLVPHLEVLGGMRERVSGLVDALDNFAGYFPPMERWRMAIFWSSSTRARRLKTRPRSR